MAELSAEQRTVHVVLGCKACQYSGDAYDLYLRDKEHHFCLSCGVSFDPSDHDEGVCPVCSGKLYSEV